MGSSCWWLCPLLCPAAASASGCLLKTTRLVAYITNVILCTCKGCPAHWHCPSCRASFKCLLAPGSGSSIHTSRLNSSSCAAEPASRSPLWKAVPFRSTSLHANYYSSATLPQPHLQQNLHRQPADQNSSAAGPTSRFHPLRPAPSLATSCTRRRAPRGTWWC